MKAWIPRMCWQFLGHRGSRRVFMCGVHTSSLQFFSSWQLGVSFVSPVYWFISVTRSLSWNISLGYCRRRCLSLFLSSGLWNSQLSRNLMSALLAPSLHYDCPVFQCSLKGRGCGSGRAPPIMFKPLVSAPGATKTKVIRIIFFFCFHFLLGPTSPCWLYLPFIRSETCTWFWKSQQKENPRKGHCLPTLSFLT